MGFELIIALVAGFVSFISPCVLPLVPAYIGYMGGRVTHNVSTQMQSDGTLAISRPLSERFSTFLHGVAFVLGFTLIFVALGLMTTAFRSTFGSTSVMERTIGHIGGVLIIFLGLHFMGALSWLFRRLRAVNGLLASPLFSLLVAVLGSALIAWMFTDTLAIWNIDSYPMWSGIIALSLIGLFLVWLVLGGAFMDPHAFWNNLFERLETTLYSDTRRQHVTAGKEGLVGSGLMGIVFAAGWSPCIGPTLGLALTMAANQPSGADVTHAASLMTAYSLGLGIPFLLTALMLDSAQAGLRRLTPHMNTIKLVSGTFLIIIGYTIASNKLQDLSSEFSIKFGDFSVRLEQCIIGTVEGDVRFGQLPGCLNDDPRYDTIVALNEGRITEADINPDGSFSEPEDEIRTDSVSIVSGAQSNATNSNFNPVVGLAPGNTAPEFTTTTVDGETVSLSDYRGQVVLLNFWYTTCGPCLREMPEFEDAYQELHDKGFTVLAVNREERADNINAFADEVGGLSFPLLLDEDGDIQWEYNISSYPTSYLLDENGVIVFVSPGPMTTQQIHDLLAEHVS